jgi:Patatin-like phospholipase/Domain of unknown function (DUF3336)
MLLATLKKTIALSQTPYNYSSSVLVNAIGKVYAAFDKLEWLLHLALVKLKTMQSASSSLYQNGFAYLFGHIRIKRLQNFEKRFFTLRKWHLLLSGALLLRLIQKLWHRRADNVIARDLRALMESADTYEEWQAAARALDSLENRSLPLEASQVAGLRDRTTKLRTMQAKDDVHALMWALRQDSSRNVGALLGAAAEQGKVHFVSPPPAVTEYIEEMQRALHHICHCSALPLEERMAFVRELRHAYGRTGLVLSGGEFFFTSFHQHYFYPCVAFSSPFPFSSHLLGGSFSHWHFGCCKILFAEGLLPRVLSGSSGGAIAAAMLCTRTDSELQESMDTWPTAPNTDFFGPAKGVKGTIKHLFSRGTLHSAEIYIIRLQRLMGDLTFQEAYCRSGRILNIAVVAADTQEPCRILNYLTAPNVLVWSAVACSSAFPFLFAPQELLVKDASGNIVPHFSPCSVAAEEPEESSSTCTTSSAPSPGSSLVSAIGATAAAPTTPTTPPATTAGDTSSVALDSSGRMRRWCDGSLEEDLPMKCLGELFGVNYFLVSQCNPWLVPVLSGAGRLPRRLAHLIELEVKHRCGQLLALFPGNKLMKLICQPWYGDLNFVLPVSTFNVARSAVNFTPAEIIKAMRAGQRAVWSKLPAVRAACAVEVAVDAELRTLTMQARAVRRREEHAAVHAALTHHRGMRASIPSWMDLKSLGLGNSNSSDSTDDIAGSLGVRTPRADGSTDKLHNHSLNRVLPAAAAPMPVGRRNSSEDSSSSIYFSPLSPPQKEEEQLETQLGNDDMEQLSEPWETGLLLDLHRSRSRGTMASGSGNGGGNGGGEKRKLEGGVDVWKDLTALTLGEDSLDFIAP